MYILVKGLLQCACARAIAIFTAMAVVGSRVEVIQDGDTAVTVRTDVLVDAQTGLVFERKTVLAEVISEDGTPRAVVAGQKTTVAAMQVRTL